MLVQVIGAGLAGSEAAWQLAERGVDVALYEMRPLRTTAAHKTEQFAELVCSNTFKSTERSNAHGLLKEEMRLLGSLVLPAADSARVAAGSALAVDRELFSAAITDRLTLHPRIRIVREEVTTLPSPAVIATGPLTSDTLASAIHQRLGVDSLAFFDAIAPIVARDSIDMNIAFRAARYDKETMHGVAQGAYINCPLSRDEYEAFIDALTSADQYASQHDFDNTPYFEGCMPVEEMARRGRESLRFGPMKPVGLRDPRPGGGRTPYAVVQLRMEDTGERMWNIVGCQTRLRHAEQARVFRLIPGLAGAEFLRFGSMHRNSYLNTPAALMPHLSLRDDNLTMFAGQLTGVEGYTESAATGLMAGINMARMLAGDEPVIPPPTTMLGALYRYLREADPTNFQPMNANFGLVDELPDAPRDKRLKRERIAERALAHLAAWRDHAMSNATPVGA